MEANNESATAPTAPVTAGFWEKNRMVVILVATVLLTTIGVILYKRSKMKKIVAPEGSDDKKVVKLTENKYRLAMRKLWGENAVWWKEYITSVLTPTEEGESDSANAISARLVKNHEDIAGLVGKASATAGKKVSEAFKDYAVQGGAVFSAIASKDNKLGAEEDKKWKKSAEVLADALGSSDSSIRVDILKENLKRQTNAMLSMVTGKLKGDSKASIGAFDMLYNQAIGGADLVSN